MKETIQLLGYQHLWKAPYIYNPHQLCHDLTKDDGFRFQGQSRDGVTIYEKNITNREDL